VRRSVKYFVWQSYSVRPSRRGGGYNLPSRDHERRWGMEEIRIGKDDAGQRLDRFLRKYLPRASLPTIFKLIRTRQVKVNGKRAKPECRLEVDDTLVLHFAERRLAELRGAQGRREPAPAPALDILREDEHVLAVAKPPFLLVHPGRDGREATLVDSVAAYLGPSASKTFEPALAHRLDRLTSGVVLVGKTAEGLRGLTQALRRGKVRKTYLALVSGEMEEEEGKISAPLRRQEIHGSDRPRVTVDRDLGKRAETQFKVLERSRGLTLLEVRPLTGRTHQIRAHLRYAGHPIVGDPTYGDRALNRVFRGRHSLWRQWLHALSVAFRHPVTGKDMEVSAPLPADLVRVLAAEGFGYGTMQKVKG